MQDSEFRELMERIRTIGSESNIVEVKSAHGGCPQRLYDTYSSFSNQNEGGTLIFGLDENSGYSPVGVYDATDLMKRLMDIGEDMSPVVRPLIDTFEYEGKIIVVAVIPPVEIQERPCFWRAKGRLRGSYVRVGDGDKPMTEYEVYSYEAYRRHIQNELRAVDSVIPVLMDDRKISGFVDRMCEGKPNLSSIPEDTLHAVLGLVNQGKPTLLSLLLCGVYPQSIFPEFSIIASRVPGKAVGLMDEHEETFFIDSKKIEGTLDEMLKGAMGFVNRNMRNGIGTDKETGMRVDLPEYPLPAVREAILNALVHRDYSIYSEGRPIQLIMFDDRMEIRNPGGIYGDISVEALGYVQPESRNRMLVNAMEILGFTEHRYSGIPKMRELMRKNGRPEPVFESRHGEFVVTFYNDSKSELLLDEAKDKTYPENVLVYCMEPRSRKEISEFLEIGSTQYAMKRYVEPLIDTGDILLKEPDTPKSKNQMYFTNTEKDR